MTQRAHSSAAHRHTHGPHHRAQAAALRPETSQRTVNARGHDFRQMRIHDDSTRQKPSVLPLQDLWNRIPPGASFVSGPPVPAKARDVYRNARPDAAGYTENPRHFVPPELSFNSTQSDAGWTSLPALTRNAFEGTAAAYYTAAGTHETYDKDGNEIHLHVSTAMSEVLKAGEQEHCDDHAEAYKISYKEAETIIRKLEGKTFGPKPTQEETEQLVRDEFTANLTHKELGNTGYDWNEAWRKLIGKTHQRDDKKWHTVTSERTRTDPDGISTYEMSPGGSEIGKHPSTEIIKYPL